MLGAYVTFVVQNLFKPLGPAIFELYYPVALILAFIITAMVGVFAGANPDQKAATAGLLKHCWPPGGQLGADSVDSQHLNVHADWHPGGRRDWFDWK